MGIAYQFKRKWHKRKIALQICSQILRALRRICNTIFKSASTKDPIYSVLVVIVLWLFGTEWTQSIWCCHSYHKILRYRIKCSSLHLIKRICYKASHLSKELTNKLSTPFNILFPRVISEYTRTIFFFSPKKEGNAVTENMKALFDKTKYNVLETKCNTFTSGIWHNL